MESIEEQFSYLNIIQRSVAVFLPMSREMVFHPSSSDCSTVHFTGATWQPHLTLDKAAVLSPYLVSAEPKYVRWQLMDLHTK